MLNREQVAIQERNFRYQGNKCPENLNHPWLYWGIITNPDHKGWIEDKDIRLECVERNWVKCDKSCKQQKQIDCGATSECKFPFVYKNETYDHCIKQDNISPWCSTKSPFKTGYWQFCDDSCDIGDSHSIIPAGVSVSVALFIIALAFLFTWKRFKTKSKRPYPSLENRIRITTANSNSVGNRSTDIQHDSDHNVETEESLENRHRSILNGYVDMAPSTSSTPAAARQKLFENKEFRRAHVNQTTIKLNESRPSKQNAQMNDVSTLDNSVELIQMREQEMISNLAGDPSKVDKRRTINEQISFLAYNQDVEMDKSSFTTDVILGNGNFGTIFVGHLLDSVDKEFCTRVAIKTLTNSMDDEALFSLVCEMKILSNLKSHPNIVNLVGCCTSEYAKNGSLWLLLEFCEKGDMKTYLINHRQEFRLLLEKQFVERQGYVTVANCNEHDAPNPNIKHSTSNDLISNSRILLLWCHGIAEGMNYLSTEKIMHGDLAARNILLSVVNGHLTPKVADFGLSKRFYNDTSYLKKNRQHIPYKWMALEYLLDGRFHLTSDVWSYGVVLWEIFSLGQEPYPGKEYEDLLLILGNGYTLPCPANIESYVSDWKPKDFYDVITGVCFSLDPSQRATFSTLVKYIERHLTEEEIMEYKRKCLTTK